jgi:ArsR family metal-binding transcriptional regulator
MAFAAALSRGDAELSSCMELNEAESANSLERLSAMVS